MEVKVVIIDLVEQIIYFIGFGIHMKGSRGDDSVF